MSCTNPLPAFEYICPSTGLKAVSLKQIPGREPNLQIPCRKCPSCKLAKAKEWGLRCWHESQMHEENAFITLTYAPEHLPHYECLDHRDFQLFMKRFRKAYPDRKVKYFMCGEYGNGTHRPHYHLILFGYFPPDAAYHRTENGHRFYKSEELDSFWKKGFTDTSGVSYHSAGYVARYALKKQLPKEELQERYSYIDYDGNAQIRPFEYVKMSTGRKKWDGIGASWFREYAAQTVTHDYVLDPKGNQCPVPKYYLDILKYDDPNWYEKLSRERIEKAKANPDNTPDRLRQKAICTEARLKQLPRPYL